MTVHCLTSGCASSFVLNKTQNPKDHFVAVRDQSQPWRCHCYQLDRDALGNKIQLTNFVKLGGKVGN